MLQDWFWSTTLTKDGREYRWLPTFSEVDDSCESVDLQAEGHGKTLQLTLALVSPDAKTGEVQEVEVVTKDSREADVAATVAVLVAGSLYQTSLSVELPQVAATLRLKRGDGPVTLVGKEFVDRDMDPDEDVEEEELDDEAEEEAVEEIIVQKIDQKKRKKPETNGRAANGVGNAKRTKVDIKSNGLDDDAYEDEEADMDEGELDESDEDFSEDEELPVRAKKAAKKAPAAAAAAPQKKQPPASKKPGSGKKPQAKKTPKTKA